MAQHGAHLCEGDIAAAVVPADSGTGHLEGADADLPQFGGAWHIEAASGDVGLGVSGRKALIQPLAGGNVGTTNCGGHFTKGTWARVLHERDPATFEELFKQTVIYKGNTGPLLDIDWPSVSTIAFSNDSMRIGLVRCA